MTAAESCRSASPGDPMTDSYRGDSCGSFEFLNSKHRRGSSNRRDTEESDEEDRLFFPQRNEEKEAILRQIQTLNDNLGDTTEESRESSAQPESTRYLIFTLIEFGFGFLKVCYKLGVYQIFSNRFKIQCSL